MRHIHSIVLVLILAASQAAADEAGKNPVEVPAGSAQTAGTQSASAGVASRLDAAPIQAGQRGTGVAAQASNPVGGGPYRSDYRDGGYFGGRSE